MTVVYPSQILLFDEPTNDVDPVRRKLIWQYMKKLASKGHIVIVVSHNLLEVEQYADRYIMLEKGKVIKEVEINSSPIKSTNILSLFIRDTKILGEIPADIEMKYTKEELKIELVLKTEQILSILEWTLELLESGRISSYKLSPVSLEYSYGGFHT